MMSWRAPPASYDDRLRVAHLRGDRQRAPDLVAGAFVEGHDERIRLAADDRDQTIPVDERGARDTPRRHAGVVVLDVALAPEEFAGLDVETGEHAGRADDIHPVAIDGRRGARPHSEGSHQHPIGGGPLVRPEHLAGLLIERQDALGPIHRARLRIRCPIGDEDAPVGHRGTGEPGPDRDAPCDHERVGERVDDTGLVPDTQAAGATPLRPVVGEDRRHHPGDSHHDQRDQPSPGRGREVTVRHLALLTYFFMTRSPTDAPQMFPRLRVTSDNEP